MIEEQQKTYADRGLSREEVEHITTLSTSALYRRMSEGTFPRPVALGSKRRVAWIESEVLAWLRAQPRSQGRAAA